MNRFDTLLAQLASEHDRLRQECDGLRGDAEAFRAEHLLDLELFRRQVVAPDRAYGEIAANDALVDMDETGDLSPSASRAGQLTGGTAFCDRYDRDPFGVSRVPSVMSSPSGGGGVSMKKLTEGSAANSFGPLGGANVPGHDRKHSSRAPALVESSSIPSVDLDESVKTLGSAMARRAARIPSLPSTLNSNRDKKRFPSKSSSRNGIPEYKLQPVWAQDSTPDGPREEVVKALADATRSASGLHLGGARQLPQLSTSCLQMLVMAPSSRPRIAWDILSSVVLAYDILSVPVVAFVLAEESSPHIELLQLITTTFWTVDILFSFFSGYHGDCALEMRPRKIAKRYLRGWFLLDFPVVAMDWCASVLMQGQLSEVIGIMRINKIARVVRVLRVIRLLRVMKLPGWAEGLSDSVRSESVFTVLGILRSLLIISVASHYVACFWYFFGSLERECTWFSMIKYTGSDTIIWHRGNDTPYYYLTALHWSLTQFTPASMEVYPTNTPERLFAIVVILSAMVAFSCFVSSITQAMATLQRTHAERDRQQGAMRRFLDENKVSVELGSQISRFARMQNMLARRRVKEGDVQIFQLLPESLRQELHWQVYMPVLSLHPLFAATLHLDDSLVLELSNTAISEVSLARYEELLHPGQEASLVYFTRSGTWEYKRSWDDEEPVDIAKDKCVCEVALWLQWEIRGVLKATTTCDAAALNASKFHETVACRPDLLEALCVYANGYKTRLEREGVPSLAEVGFLPEMLQSIVEEALIGLQGASNGGMMGRTLTGSSRGSRGSRSTGLPISRRNSKIRWKADLSSI